MNIRILVVLFIMLMGFLAAPRAQAQMDPRVKALATVAAYGTVGGALLGAASMAFWSNGRAVFQGASLGLYAGIIFGSYIILTYESRKNRGKDGEDYYPDAPAGPYEQKSFLSRPSWNPYIALDEGRYNEKRGLKAKAEPVVAYMDFLKFQF